MNAQAVIQAIREIAADPDLQLAEKRTQIRDLGAYVAALSPLDQMQVRDTLTAYGWTKGDAKEYVTACVKSLSGKKVQPVEVELPESWPYDVDEGRLCLLSKKTDEDGSVEIKATPICDFTATITEEGTTEDGAKVYTIAGCAVRSGPFTCDIQAHVC